MDEMNPHLRLEGLIRLFYREWGFRGDQQQYFSSENVFLDKVLERKKGIPCQPRSNIPIPCTPP